MLNIRPEGGKAGGYRPYVLIFFVKRKTISLMAENITIDGGMTKKMIYLD